MKRAATTFACRYSNIIGSRTPSLRVLGVCLVLAGTNVHAQSQSCFEKVKLEPSFIAFTTKKNSKLGDWYKSIFGLEIAKEFSFPDGTVTGVLMQRGEFVVEVFSRDNPLEWRDYVHNSRPEQWRGFMKFGVYTDANLLDLKQCLEGQGVKAGRIFNDKKLGIDLLQVIDPDQNVIEIISRSLE